MNRHEPTPLIYVAWMRHLQKLLIFDELGDLAELFPQPSPVFIERVFRDVDGAAGWCDIRQSTQVETCDEIAERALAEAIAELSEKVRTEHGGLEVGHCPCSSSRPRSPWRHTGTFMAHKYSH